MWHKWGSILRSENNIRKTKKMVSAQKCFFGAAIFTKNN